MENRIKVVGICKWVCFPLGYLMYYVTMSSFGIVAAVALAVAATVAFWLIIRSEQTRLIGQSIATLIRDAIQRTGDIDNMIEIKRLKSGIIARVYLINAKEKVSIIHHAITASLDDCTLKKYLWIMQLTDMASRRDLPKTQKLLNDQLLDELLKRKQGDKK